MVIGQFSNRSDDSQIEAEIGTSALDGSLRGGRGDGGVSWKRNDDGALLKFSPTMAMAIRVARSSMKNIFKKHGGFLRLREPVECEPVRTDAKAVIEHTAPNRRNDVQPVRTGSDLIPMDSPSWHSAEEHADALLGWMQVQQLAHLLRHIRLPLHGRPKPLAVLAC
jgi:hypothetical protein